MIVANLTPEDLMWTHIGVTGTIASGQIVEMEDSRARHVLNKLEARGLLRLQFGDDPQAKKDTALKIYREFWIKQVTVFNQDQERRKHQNREPIYPTDQLVQKAKEMGIEIIGPWAYKPNENSEIESLRKKNQDLESQMGMILQELRALRGVTGASDTPVATKTIEEKVEIASKKAPAKPENDPLGVSTPLPEEYEKIWKAVEKVKKEKFIEWIMDNAAILQDPKTPQALVNRLEMKWRQVVPTTDWPLAK